MEKITFSLTRLLALVALVLLSQSVFANDHGGGGAAPEPMKFTVNVGDKKADSRYLQIEIVFEFASPEAGPHLAAIKPRIQHRLILLLTSEEVSSLLSTKGKIELAERIVENVNELLGETPKTGVKEVLFTNFIVQ